MNTTQLVGLISGKQRGLMASAIRAGLRCLVPLYGVAVGWRNRKFDSGKGVVSVSTPVISVGNLTTGGTGKTPFILRLAALLSQRGYRVVLVSRGYGRGSAEKNDEALELECRLPGIIHLQNANRVAAARTAGEQYQADVILLDDGFQHRRLDRDLDLVLIDATNPFGFESLLPRGLLREPITSLKRADFVVLTRADQVGKPQRTAILDRIAQANPNAPVLESRVRATGWTAEDGRQLPLDALPSSEVIAFGGIGNPQAFFRQLESLGVHLLDRIEFPDHHRYSPSDLARIQSVAQKHQARSVVCTHKDLVKISETGWDIPLLALTIEMQLEHESELLGCIERILIDGNEAG